MKIFEEWVLGFMGRFNAGDLDGAMSDFTEQGQYIDEFGNSYLGKSQIRTALSPIFDGSYGSLVYTVDDMILEPEKERALVTWTLSITGSDSGVSKMRGLDILEFDGEKVKSKNCYIKAKEVLIEAIT